MRKYTRKAFYLPSSRIIACNIIVSAIISEETLFVDFGDSLPPAIHFSPSVFE